ncbi:MULTISPECIES: histidine phosphatase family protein [Labrys]|nr:histidine phosphatase family protein [Labrys okinawensis]
MAPTLYFMRHGETDWNAEARLQGQQDIPLNEAGRRQAAEAGHRLAEILPEPDGLPWLVSPLGRTRETAELARKAIGLPPQRYTTDDRLKELTFGDWEGRTWAELRSVDRNMVKARTADKWAYVPPRGESYAMLHDRIALWLKTVTQDQVVVSHGGVARVLMVLLAGKASGQAAEEPIWQGKLLVFRNKTAEWV